MPSGIVVQCQSQRSQHSNRDTAFKMLRAALYEKELERRQKELDAIAGERKANEWGSQIRSYILHPYQLAKDHRTDFETSNPSAVLDGELNGFIHAYLREKALAGKSDS
jgi:peptide chain release factor 2